MDHSQSVAFIITHTIKAGEEERYEAWLIDMLSAVSRAPGYLGREVFRPAQGRRTYTSILRFDVRARGYDVWTPVMEPAVARGSRTPHPPFSTAVTKRSTIALKSSGSSRFSV